MLSFTSSADLAPMAEGLFRDASANLAKIRGGREGVMGQFHLAEIQRAKAGRLQSGPRRRWGRPTYCTERSPEQNRLVLHVLLTDTRTGVNAKEWNTDYAPGQERYVPMALAGEWLRAVCTCIIRDNVREFRGASGLFGWARGLAKGLRNRLRRSRYWAGPSRTTRTRRWATRPWGKRNGIGACLRGTANGSTFPRSPHAKPSFAIWI